MSIQTHLPHKQPSPIAASTPSTTPNSSPTSTQILSLQTLLAACPICSTYFSQPFAHYSIITPTSSSKPINPLALLPLLGSPLKSSVLSLPAAVWNAPILHHTQFSTLNCFGLLPTSLIKSQSFISTYKPTPLPPQLILSHLHTSSTPLFHTCHLTRNRQSTLSII